MKNFFDVIMTIFLRRVVLSISCNGHCVPDGGGGNGHCY